MANHKFFENGSGARRALFYICKGNYLDSKGWHIRKIKSKWHILDERDVSMISFKTLRDAFCCYLRAFDLHEI